MEKRTAIIFSGSAYNIRFSLDSLLRNVVIPNNADVFVLTTRGCKRRKTPASDYIPDCDIDWEGYSKKNDGTIVDTSPLTDEELRLIKNTFGDTLKGLYVFEEMERYHEYVVHEREKMVKLVNEYIDESLKRRIPPPFNGLYVTDHDFGTIRYTVDQYRHVNACYWLMDKYEEEHGFKYDYVMRARIDFKAKEEIKIEHYTLNHDEPYLYVMGSFRRDPFEWSDEFCWFSNRRIAEKLFPSLGRIGFIVDRRYKTLDGNNDLMFSPEVQFSLLLRELDMPVVNVKIYRSAEYTHGGDGFDYFNYRFRRDKIKIEDEYKLVCECKTDINEHLPKLREYAEKCDHITELGTRYGNSTIAFMAAKPEYFVSYDVQHNNKIDYLILVAKENEINFEFKLENPTPENGESLLEETDLLFIDTNHHATQCRLELRLHASKVRKYIIFHDTETFWNRGAGDDHMDDGMKLAIEPFLEQHKEWHIKERFSNNNGLMILERI